MKSVRSTFASFLRFCPLLVLLLAVSSICQTATQPRTDLARNLQSQLMQKGIKAYVSLQGADLSVMRVEWKGINGPAVYKLVNSRLVRDGAKSAGVKTIVFADGGGDRNCQYLTKDQCEQRWDYNVETESMVSRPSYY